MGTGALIIRSGSKVIFISFTVYPRGSRQQKTEMMIMKVKYEEMTPREFIEAVNELHVFIVPTGLLEWHGDHLPLGQDALKAYGICLRVAAKLGGGIVLPLNYWGRPGFSTYVGTLTFSEGLIRSLFWELFEQLRKVGAKIILVVTGH
jgi:creatinine amidohydrolase